MSTDFINQLFDETQDPAAYDPVRSARGAMKTHLPKRFYTEVTIAARGENGETLHLLLLDGKPARTKGRALLAAPNPESAALLAQEWVAQGEFITPATMPVTRILHTAIDHVAGARAAVIADILAYAGSDLVCYRVDEPLRLVEMQKQHWDPVLRHIATRYGARFILSQGILHVTQPEMALQALKPRLESITHPVALGALHVLTTLSGSALIALCVADGVLDAKAGYQAGEVDADYETAIWGQDAEASARNANRFHEFAAATALLCSFG